MEKHQKIHPKKNQPRKSKCSDKSESITITLDTPPGTPQPNEHDENDDDGNCDFDLKSIDSSSTSSNTSQHSCNEVVTNDDNSSENSFDGEDVSDDSVNRSNADVS